MKGDLDEEGTHSLCGAKRPRKSSLPLCRNPKSGFEVIVFNRNPFVGRHAIVLPPQSSSRPRPPFLFLLFCSSGWHLHGAGRARPCPRYSPSLRRSFSSIPASRKRTTATVTDSVRPTGQPATVRAGKSHLSPSPIMILA